MVFAMTSRRPEAFDDIALQVTQEKAADFHERWVLGYGHASVAEHAIIHMAVENVSRRVCDTLEDNRLASYTEKSSRYQLLPHGYYHVPAELEAKPKLRKLYITTCDDLFDAYGSAVDRTVAYLKEIKPQDKDERDSAYLLRLRREATDSCRFLLPASTLTNVGVTMNARVMEHAVSKLLSSELSEERALGEELMRRGKDITPTLIKYAAENEYITSTRKRQRAEAESLHLDDGDGEVSLVEYDRHAEETLASALLYRYGDQPYSSVRERVEKMDPEERFRIIDGCLENLGDHDSPVRELELVDYTFEIVMDYGAYREFKRHRMQTYVPQPLGVSTGYLMPDLLKDAGLASQFVGAMDRVGEAYRRVHEEAPEAAAYLVTHAHKRRLLFKMNLRECYHLFKLRTQSQAHFSIRRPIEEAMKLAVQAHPRLFKHLRLREFPQWWKEVYSPEETADR